MPKIVHDYVKRLLACRVLLETYAEEQPDFKLALFKYRIISIPDLLKCVDDMKKQNNSLGAISLDYNNKVFKKLYQYARVYEKNFREYLKPWELPEIPHLSDSLFYGDWYFWMKQEKVHLSGYIENVGYIKASYLIGMNEIGAQEIAKFRNSKDIPVLKLEIPAWSLIQGRDKLLKTISDELGTFERELKISGYKEFPSQMKQHARWWFLNRVKKLKYKTLAQQMPGPKGKQSDAYSEESIKRAVFNFSKMLGEDRLM